jgi:pimeloyl-ACP methyl ester carboxylesterase
LRAFLALPSAISHKPVAILCHGLGVDSSYHLITTLKGVLLKHGYPVFLFDFAGHGMSGGAIKDRLVRNFVADLRDCIGYLGKHSLMKDGIVLVGHSIGALTILLYAGRYPKNILGIVPIASNAEAKRKEDDLISQGKIHEFKRYTMIGRSKVPKQFWKDRLRFEPKSFAKRLRMPALFIVGSRDSINPPKESKQLYAWAPASRKALSLITGADHSFRPLTHQKAVARKTYTWLEKNI